MFQIFISFEVMIQDARMFVFLFLIITPSLALRFPVDGKECLKEEIPEKGMFISGSFVVFNHDNPWREWGTSIDLEIRDPFNNPVYNIHKKSEAEFSFLAESSGLFTFCLINEYPVTEVVDFFVHYSQTENKFPESVDFAHQEHFDQMRNHYLMRITNLIEEVKMDQQYFKARDFRRKKTNTSTSTRLFYYALLETLVLVLANLAQFFFLIRMFEKRWKSFFPA